MDAVIASAIAVPGTLLGSGLTLSFQQRTVESDRALAREETLRQERLDTYSACANSLVNYRRCLLHLWFCAHEESSPENEDQIRRQVFELRSKTQEAILRFQMISGDQDLNNAAKSLLVDINTLHKASSRPEFDQRRERTLEGIDNLASLAAQHISTAR